MRTTLGQDNLCSLAMLVQTLSPEKLYMCIPEETEISQMFMCQGGTILRTRLED